MGNYFLNFEKENVSFFKVRVVQSKEPLHFLAIFQDYLIILLGGTASGFRGRKAEKTEDTEETRLFQIRNKTASQVVVKYNYIKGNLNEYNFSPETLLKRQIKVK